MVQSDDLCTFHPVQAVTAVKEASEIGVGDIVFCRVQRSGGSQQFYAHIVLAIQHDYHAQEPKYWIGNIEQNVNGWCFREHIYGVLVQVQVEWQQHHYTRPFPKQVYEQVRKLVADNRWNRSAARLCAGVEDDRGELSLSEGLAKKASAMLAERAPVMKL